MVITDIETPEITKGDRVEFTPEARELMSDLGSDYTQLQGVLEETWVKETGIYFEILFDDDERVTLHSKYFQRVEPSPEEAEILYDDIPF